MINKTFCGDCVEIMKNIADNSVDSIVTDPPYELGFMGKGWDKTGIAYNVEMWRECLRVLKPGGHLLSFGGTRTYHRMAVAIEDAGFEVRDMIEWVYGSGFPKSLNIGKAVDKLQGNERVDVGHYMPPTDSEYYEKGFKPTDDTSCKNPTSFNLLKKTPTFEDRRITKGTSEWEGWGTALKPAHEPIIWATKDLTFNNKCAILYSVENNLGETIWQSLNELQKQGISRLQETVSIHLNIVLLWQNILAELLKKENKSIISTESKPIIELKILNSLLLKNTQDNTGGKYQTCQNGIQKSQANGFNLLANIVETCLAGEKKNTTDIQTLIAQGLVTWKRSRTGLNVKSAEKDLLTIILNANSVLINVLTDLITNKEASELSTFVNFVEKSLKQYLAEPQSIADENVWQEHIQKALPNHSPICMARKPLAEKTVAENVLKWGTGGINIDESRVGTEDKMSYSSSKKQGVTQFENGTIEQNPLGRFPANLILSWKENEYIIKDDITNEQKQKALKWIYENA